MYTSAQSIKDYLHAAEQQGVDTHALRDELGLSESMLADGQAPVDACILIKLLQTVVPLSGNPLFGLTQAMQVQANSFQILGYLALNSHNIKETMELVIQYEQASGTTGTTFVEEHGDKVLIGWECAIDDPMVERHMVENVLASWRLYSKNFVNLDEAPQQVWFRHRAPERPGIADEYQKILGAETQFEQDKNGIWITREQWLRPLPQANQSMLSVLEKHAAGHAENVARLLDSNNSVSQQVSRLLRLMLPHTIPQKRNIARQIGVSERTLQRMLAREGTQYKTLLADVRLTLAEELIRSNNHSSEQIAQQLGFTELRSFYRFVKQNTGKTVQQIRNREI